MTDRRFIVEEPGYLLANFRPSGILLTRDQAEHRCCDSEVIYELVPVATLEATQQRLDVAVGLLRQVEDDTRPAPMDHMTGALGETTYRAIVAFLASVETPEVSS